MAGYKFDPDKASAALEAEHRDGGGSNGGGGWCLFFVLIIPACMVLDQCEGGFDCGGSSTDGVYESATDKLDRGEELNDAEKKRINDIINYED